MSFTAFILNIGRGGWGRGGGGGGGGGVISWGFKEFSRTPTSPPLTQNFIFMGNFG